MQKFETEAHSKDIELIYNKPSQDIEDVIYENSDVIYDLKTRFRFYRKSFSAFWRKRLKKDFKKILLVTKEMPPIDYVLAFQKQYPDKKIKVLIPIYKIENYEKACADFDFYLQNRINYASLYKLPKKRENIEIYGLYSDAWANSDLKRFQNLAPFVKALRICAKKIKPDIIHSENIPFFLGAEFESKFPYPIKVFQQVKDFSLFEMNKVETFWAGINLVDKQGMRKICKDKVIKKCIASLFNLHNTKRFYQMRECLNFIYKNYSKFRKFVDKCEDIDENILFNRMNARILKLFPQMAYEDELFYNSMYYTIKKSDFWAVHSKTYYNELLKRPELSGKMFKRLKKTEIKSSSVSYGCDLKEEKIYQQFSVENFRELRERNKKYLIKEFSKERIETKFVDFSLFNNENYIIRGYLDSFYEAPLIFCTFAPEIFSQGIDIAFTNIVKLFELNKNVQVIINIPDGLKQNYVKSCVEFLEQNRSFAGKWVFIDGNLNLAQFFASCDLALFPQRTNSKTVKHYISMKYGCVPVAARSGIFNDTIADIFDDITNGCGFKTKTTLFTNDNVNEIYYNVLAKALNLYVQNPSSWNLLIKNSMNYDSSWSFQIIEKYNEIYELL